MLEQAKESWIRLFVGLILNALLYFFIPQLAHWSSIEREFRLSLIGGSLAMATVVFVAPVFWRGVAWQAPIAFVLIFFLPGLVFFSVFSTLWRHLSD